MAAMVALLGGCMESFRSILTSQDFGSEYELLCTQLSIQWLRIRLWGESLGLQIEVDSPLNDATFDRPDIQATVNRAITNIAYLLTEIDVLRRKYEVRPRLEAITESTKNDSKTSELSRSLSISQPISNFRQRIRDNQKQKSFLAIAKWAISDAKKFDEKVKQVKGLIDGLEDIARAATFTRTPPRPSASTTPEDSPPPYSEIEARHRTLQHSNLPLTRANSVRNSNDTSLLPHHQTFKIFLAGVRASPEPPRLQPRDKLIRLSNVQFQELRTDVYDDLLRRQHHSSNVQSLPPNNSYHPKRNQAREKLSTLLPHRFRHLVTDTMIEMCRRFPYLDDTPAVPANSASDPLDSATAAATRRQGCVPPYGSPPAALLHSRPLHRSTISSDSLSRIDADYVSPNRASTVMGQANVPVLTWSNRTGLTRDAVSRLQASNPEARSSAFVQQNGGHNLPPALPTSSFSTSAFPSRTMSDLSTAKVQIFKSFRVSMKDACSKVLPAALKKYNISAPPEDYALYIMYGDCERCMGLDEKPLLVFRALDRAGKKPLFMLRKIARAYPEIAGEIGGNLSGEVL